MNGFTFLIYIQIWSLQSWLHATAVPTVSTGQALDQTRARSQNGPNKFGELGNDGNTNAKANLDGNLHKDDFGTDGSFYLDDSFEDFDYPGTGEFEETEVEGLETYDPITDTFNSNSHNGDRGKETRGDSENSHLSPSGDGRHTGSKVKSDRGANDIHRNSLNGSLIRTRTRHHKQYQDVVTITCPKKCACDGTKVDCVGKNLTAVPKGISAFTTWLDLSMNSLQKLPEDTFAHMTFLKELRCVGNNLTELPHRLFRHNSYLQLLNFQGNYFSRVPQRAFQNLSYLQELHLDANEIASIPKNAFHGLISLKQLWLDDNKLSHVPASALQELPGLQALTLIKNEITHLPDYVFQNNTRLIQLRLANNAIREVQEYAFYGLTRLKYLQLQHNEIKTIPSALSHLVSLVELNLKYNQVTAIPEKSFQMKNKLTTLILEHNPITFVAETAFANLPGLQEIKLSDVHEMTKFPDLTGTENLTALQIDRANIEFIPGDLCANLKKLKSLDLHSNRIVSLHSISQCRHLAILIVGNNKLASIDGQIFLEMNHIKDITLLANLIHTISEDTFVGLVALEYLNLATNQISYIHPNAFLPLRALKELNLGNNKIQHLPTAGLVSLQKLKVPDNPDLREFPPKEEFPNVNLFVLSYAYHCCDFMLSRPEQIYLDIIREHVVWMEAGEPGQLAMWEFENDSRMGDMMAENFTSDADLYEHMGDSGFHLDRYHDPYAPTYLEDQHQGSENTYFIAKAAISCKPSPGPFMPCDDLFGWWSLRCGVWFVFMLALLGNGVVFFVSVTSKSKMDVPRFLICNLALADFFMGIYLGILAIMDASTLGHFKKYAIKWQMSAGCLVAGTLGVLSSELSVFTLTVITLERFYAITHAMQLNKRLSLKHAGAVMMCGWIWSFGLAVLPLFGISDYRKFAVCLPFEINDVISKSYVCFIMVFNGISFFIIMGCYLAMYISIRDSQAWNSNDTRVAKRMALLVFTDFLCWAPIAFLSLAAAFGKNLIELNEAKVLTIFILPLNSCANPFLYAFFTKQFKKDCVLLCRRLEDSFVARHFSQVTQRHASMSWKNQRRPSALHSLMGESKSNNSQNNSTGSNSYGLLNYNSETSSGTNKTAGKDITKSDMYVTQATVYSVSSSGGGNSGTTYYKHALKYVPCPSSENDDESNAVKNAYADISDDDDDDIQIILHQDFYSQRETAIQGCMDESCICGDSEHLTLSSHKLCADFPEDDLHTNANACLQYPSVVIHENGNPRRDEDYLWTRRSLQKPLLELQDMSQSWQNVDTEQTGRKSDHDKCNVTKVTEKQINVRKQNNLIIFGNKNSEVDCKVTNSVNEEKNNQLIGKFSLNGTDIACHDERNKEKLVAISEKQKTSDSKNMHQLFTDVCEGKCVKSYLDKWRENMQGSRTASSPVEHSNNICAYATETRMLESELCNKCKHVRDMENIRYMAQEIKNDKATNQEADSGIKRTPTTADSQLDNSPAALVILLKRDHTEITNSPVNQKKIINLSPSLSIGCYTKQCLSLASQTKFCSKTIPVLQETKQLNIYQQQFYKELQLLPELCASCDKHTSANSSPNRHPSANSSPNRHPSANSSPNRHPSANSSPNNWVNRKSLAVSASTDSVLTPGHHQTTEDKSAQRQSHKRSVTGSETVSRSNSLVELSQINMADEVKAPLLASVKRRSLPPDQEYYVLHHAETYNCIVQR